METIMQRRHFLQAASGSFAVGALAGCSPTPARRATATDRAAPLDAERFHAERRYLDTAFGRIAYIERGHGPAALFLHGFPLNSFQWRGAIERLSALRRCVAADFLGLGYTQVRDGQSCAPAAQVNMLAAVLDRLGVGAVDLIANDSGGAVAQLFMLRYPQRVRTVLLTNCDVEPDSPPPALQPVLQLAREGKFADAWLAPWVADKTLARSREGLGGLTYTYPDKLSDEAIDYYLAPLVASPRRKALLHAYALGLDPNPLAGIEAQLRTSHHPVRIVWGTGDDIFSAASPDYLDKLLPNSRGVRRIDGAKLFFPEEFPGEIAKEARGLWRSAQRQTG
jgi:pimeloyl-ACP methyl ester carboxylesterase